MVYILWAEHASMAFLMKGCNYSLAIAAAAEQIGCFGASYV